MRFRQPARHFGINFRPRAENRANRFESAVQHHAKNQQHHKRHSGHAHAGAQQIHHRDHRRHNAARELDQPCADQVAHAFHVAHDPRNQHARLVRVVERHRQPPDMRLHFFAQLGNHAPGRFGEQLRQCVGSKALNHRRRDHSQHNHRQQVRLPLQNHVVQQIFCRRRQHQP